MTYIMTSTFLGPQSFGLFLVVLLQRDFVILNKLRKPPEFPHVQQSMLYSENFLNLLRLNVW